MMRGPEHLNKHLRFRDCLRPHVFFGFCHKNLISCVDVSDLLGLVGSSLTLKKRGLFNVTFRRKEISCR